MRAEEEEISSQNYHSSENLRCHPRLEAPNESCSLNSHPGTMLGCKTWMNQALLVELFKLKGCGYITFRLRTKILIKPLY